MRMHNFFGKLVRTGLVCGILMTAVPMTSMAAIGPGFKTGFFFVFFFVVLDLFVE